MFIKKYKPYPIYSEEQKIYSNFLIYLIKYMYPYDTRGDSFSL